MCKLLLIPKVPTEKQEQLKEFCLAARPFLTKHDSHGFGYMGIDNDDNLVAERWLNVKKALKYHKPLPLGLSKLVDMSGKALAKPEVMYNSFGPVNDSMDNIKSICLHSRLSTNTIRLENTHPFVFSEDKLKEYALVHNGIVDETKLTLRTSTCDSEGILNQYILDSVDEDIKNFAKTAKNLSGYYACGMYSKNDAGWYLDIFKSSDARLIAAYIHELNTIVFCTNIQILRDTCKQLKWNVSTCLNFKDNFIARYNVDTGLITDSSWFEEGPSRFGGGYYRTTDKTVSVGNTYSRGGNKYYSGQLSDWEWDQETDQFKPVKSSSK